MPDYQQMYLTLFRAVTRAIDTLVQAQQQCEELYLQAGGETERCAREPEESVH